MKACPSCSHPRLNPSPLCPPLLYPSPADLAELQNLLHFLLPTVFAAQGFEDLAEMLQVRALHPLEGRVAHGTAAGSQESAGGPVHLLLCGTAATTQAACMPM